MGAPTRRRQRLDKQRIANKRHFALKMLTEPTSPRRPAVGPLSPAIKAKPEGQDEAVEAFLAKRRENQQPTME